MINVIKGIFNNGKSEIYSIFVNDIVDIDKFVQSICVVFYKSNLAIKSEVADGVINVSNKVDGFSNIYKDFVDNELRTKIKTLLKNELSKITKEEKHNCIVDILKREIQYLYKKYQVLVIDKSLYKFVSHETSCAACKFAMQNKYVTDKFIEFDDCDSYFVKDELLETVNIETDYIKLFNVPKKYYRTVLSFYNFLQFKYQNLLKSNVNIEFKTCTKIDKCLDDSVEVRFLYNKNEQQYHICFDLTTYRYYILKAILTNVLITEDVEKIYYSKLENDIFASNKFISFLAKQNIEEYYMESLIEYILNPDKLYEVDEEIYNYFNKELGKV